MFRRVSINYHRERIITEDNDFLDLDWVTQGNENLVIICHGLEGSSKRAYIKGVAKYFMLKNWSALAWNFRGCSEEMNRNIRFYHSGATEDLETVIRHVNLNHQFDKIYLLGFSLGGNLILKYLGEQSGNLPANIVKGLAFSVPLDLHTSCLKISRGVNRIYGDRFLRKLKHKVRQKADRFPGSFDLKKLSSTKNLIDFDDHFTAPIHGFKDALDYYQTCSALRVLPSISKPVLIVNALNDPFLSETCYPTRIHQDNPLVEILMPEQGGHCGFADGDFDSGYWSEVLAWNYLSRK
ncbi:MAG: alpha/beta hydrolase [Cyclobacteriaceae bacterium]|nr:MAG: alpha/beta hydrolase [Cyclobacteriaceae bacterium]